MKNVTVPKKAIKSIKGTSWYKNYHQFTNLPPTDAYYPSSIWQVTFMQSERGTLLNKYYSERLTLDSFYIPKIGDILTRSPTAHQYAIITSVSAPNTKGFLTLRVWVGAQLQMQWRHLKEILPLQKWHFWCKIR